jgi:hypothetical protein
VPDRRRRRRHPAAAALHSRDSVKARPSDSSGDNMETERQSGGEESRLRPPREGENVAETFGIFFVAPGLQDESI